MGRHYEVPISVTRHAVWRCDERFPELDPQLIVPEVRAAFDAGRVSGEKPPGIWHSDDQSCLYAWTEDGARVYVLTTNRFARHENFAVKTVLRAMSRAEFLAYKETPAATLVIERPSPNGAGLYRRTRRVRGRRKK